MNNHIMSDISDRDLSEPSLLIEDLLCYNTILGKYLSGWVNFNWLRPWDLMNLLHDIKQDNGSIIAQCYPNETLGNFVSYHHGNVIDARTIHQIRLSQEQLPVLLTKEQKEG